MQIFRVQPIRLLHQRGLRRALPLSLETPEWREATGPLGQVYHALLHEPRSTAHRRAEELLVFEEFNPEWLHLPIRPAGRPLVEPLMAYWLPRLLQQSGPLASPRSSDKLHPDGQPTVLRQLARVLDVKVPQLLVGAPESRLYLEMQSDVRMVGHPLLGRLSSEELRFMALRAFFHHYQRHGELWSLTRAWDVERRQMTLNLFWVWNLRFGQPILRDQWLKGFLTCDRLVPLSQWLNRLHESYPTAAVRDLRELLVRPRPFDRPFRTQAEMFACAGTDLVTACYALARCALPVQHWEQLDEGGLALLTGELQGCASPLGWDQIQRLLTSLYLQHRHSGT